mmetsp:Transcript_21009/g.67708  ORF Transcript_21009/g.67708 Transcript_21009/m.67708 type:complete len:287 (+) Transcript_21009:640-1500(+)
MPHPRHRQRVRPLPHPRQVPQLPVPPVVERGDGGAGAALRVQLHRGGSEAEEAREEGLVEAAVLLEGHAFHHGRQLVVVADQNHALESWLLTHPRLLQRERDERLQIRYLRCLLHDQRVVTEPHFQQLLPRDGRVRARHGHHARLTRQQVLGSPPRRPQQLQGAVVGQLVEDAVQVSEAALGRSLIRRAVRAREQRLRGRVGEEGREGKQPRHRIRRVLLAQLQTELLHARHHVLQPEVSRRLARVRHARLHAQRRRQSLHLPQARHAPLQRVLHAPRLAVIPRQP